MTEAENPLRTSLLSALDEARAVFKRLRMNDARRGEVARRIVAIEDAIDALGDDL